MMLVNGFDTKRNLLTMSYYNKCLKLLFFHYKRGDSVTQILLDTGSPSFSTIMFNSEVNVTRSVMDVLRQTSRVH